MWPPEDEHQLRAELDRLQNQVRSLTDRVAAMEAAARHEEFSAGLDPDRPRAEAPDDHADVDIVPVTEPLEPEPSQRPVADDEPSERVTPAVPAISPAAPAAPAAPPVAAALATTTRRGPELSNLEWLVGTRGIALLGVVILVIAAGLFFKEAWDRGWIATIPDWLRCAGGAAFGAALVGVGEVLRRRVNPLASAGVSAAGIAIVFGAILAAAELYELLPEPVAFGLLAATALVGVGLGALSQRVLLAALSLVGAFLVPVVLDAEPRSTVVLPAYLLSLLALGLVLSGWRGPAYGVIRRLAWWGTAGLGTLWILTMVDVAVGSVLLFTGLVWAMTVGELVASARFFGVLRQPASWPTDGRHGVTVAAAGTSDAAADGPDRPPLTIRLELASLLSPEARWLLTAFGVTAWTVIAAGYAVTEHWPALDWTVPAVLATASAGVATACWPPRVAAWLSAATPRTALASVMWLNATALAVLTNATGLGGGLQVTVWAVVGLAAVVAGMRLHFRAANIFGLLLLAVAIGRVLTIDLLEAIGPFGGGGATIVLHAFGIAATAWTLQVILVTAATVAAAWLQREHPFRTLSASAAVGIAAAIFLGPGSDATAMGAAWAVLAAGVVAGIGVRWNRRDVRILAGLLAGLGTAVAAIALGDAWRPPGTLGGSAAVGAGRVAWTDDSWALSVIAAAWLGMGSWPGRRPEVRGLVVLAAIGSLVVATIGGGTSWETVVLVAAGLAAATGGLGAAPMIRGRLASWPLPPVAIVAAGAAAIGWGIRRVLSDWPATGAPPLWHAVFISGVLIAATLGVAAWSMRPTRPPARWWDDDEAGAPLRAAGFAVGGLVLLVATSAELVRVIGIVVPGDSAAQGAALSIWWSLFAAALIWAGIAVHQRVVRWPGLLLLGLTAVKVLAVDLGTLTPMWRIAGSAIVGLVLLGAGVAYAWLMRDTRAERAGEGVPDGTPRVGPAPPADH